MSVRYDVQIYLLDKANIQDTIVRTMHLFDTDATKETINWVYTTEVQLDYDALLGFSPEVVSSEAWAKRLDKFTSRTTARSMSSSEASLFYRPTTVYGESSPYPPDRCQAFAYAHGWFYNRDADNRPCLMARRQGGTWRVELVRLQGLEEKGENPWGINKQEVRLSWQDKGVQ